MPSLQLVIKKQLYVGCGRGGMVDAADLKSVFRKGVGVRVPPPAPNLCLDVWGFLWFFAIYRGFL